MAESGRRVAELASVSQEGPLARAVEEGPQIVAGPVVLARVGPAVVGARAAHFDAHSRQVQHVLAVGRRSRLDARRTGTGNDPLAVDDNVLHAADKERQSLGQNAQERSGATQDRHPETRFRRVDGFHRIDGVQGLL